MTGQSEPHLGTQRSIVARRVQSIPPSGIRRFFDLISTMDDVISLSIGEPDFVTPWRIREAAIYAIEKGYTMYTSNHGMIELREELARHLGRLYGLRYDPGRELLITVGVSEALDIALRAILDEGDEVLIPDPGYVSYAPNTVLAGGVPVMVPTSPGNEFKMDPAAIVERIGPRTKALLVAYPNNPTGTVMTREELTAVAEIARRHDLLVLSDEIYDRLVYGIEHTCFAALPEMRDRTILLGGFSKDYAMTGWRVGYAAARGEILDAMVKIHQYTMLCAPIVSQMAAIEALRSGEPDVQEMVDEYDRRRRVIVKGLREIGLKCNEPRGAFYAFPSVRSTGLTSEDFAERLLFEERVAVVPGNAFGPCGEGHVRCCYATAMPQIDEALTRLGRFVGRLKCSGDTPEPPA